MALMLMDRMHLTRDCFGQFGTGAGNPHKYMIHVGAGWAFARLPFLRGRPVQMLRGLDPVLGWMALDGFGFHQGYFHWPDFVRRHSVPKGFGGYAIRVFDQGLGRSLWFIETMDPERISAAIASFPESRRSDLWSGVGLACAYAGGAELPAVRMLYEMAGNYRLAFAQGAAFAAEARCRAGNLTHDNDATCNAICGFPATEAALMVRRARDAAADTARVSDIPAYELWRARVQRCMSPEVAMR
jgi:hypothetical protein